MPALHSVVSLEPACSLGTYVVISTVRVMRGTMLQIVIEVFISCYINLEELKGKSEKGSFKV